MAKNRILMIDDDEELVAETSSILEDAGYAVDRAFDGNKGKNLACNGSYDLILLDVKMPRITGTDILKDLKNRKITSKVIIVTGSLIIGSFFEEHGIISLADGFIEKPFHPGELLAKIEKILL